MNKKLVGVSCLALAWAVSSEASQTEDKQPQIELKRTFVAGQSFYQEISTETHQKMKVQGLDVAQTQKQTFWIKWTPTAEGKTTWIIEQEILGVKIDLGPGRNDPPGGPLAAFQKALVGAKFLLTVNKLDMSVEKIDGREAFVQKLIEVDKQLKPLLEAVFSEDAIKQLAEPIFGVLPPGGAVPKDKRWTRRTTLNLGPIGTYQSDHVFTLGGLNPEKLWDISLPRTTVPTNQTSKPSRPTSKRRRGTARSSSTATKGVSNGRQSH